MTGVGDNVASLTSISSLTLALHRLARALASHRFARLASLPLALASLGSPRSPQPSPTELPWWPAPFNAFNNRRDGGGGGVSLTAFFGSPPGLPKEG